MGGLMLTRGADGKQTAGGGTEVCWPYLQDRLPLPVQAEQPRRYRPSRKVRTPQGRVVGNADPGKPAGKCHRKHTAHVRGDGRLRRLPAPRAGKVEKVR